MIVNWNGADDTIECLESLAAAHPSPDHVVVVDNDSSDDSVDRIIRWARTDSPTMIRAPENRGFAGGNNLGLEYLRDSTDATHFLLLNNDATVDPAAFAAIGRAINEGYGTGLLTGTIYYGHGEAKDVWYAGGREIPMRALYAHNLEIPGDEPIATEFISGCAMLISRAALERLGPLPECYFLLYWEDVEYSYRAIQARLPVVYDPRIVFHHRVGSTAGLASESPFVAETQNRLRALFVRRNYVGVKRIIALGYLAITKPGRAVVEILSGRPRIGWAILRGTARGFTMPVDWTPVYRRAVRS